MFFGGILFGLRFLRVEGLGFRVFGLGLGFSASGFRAQGFLSFRGLWV